MAITEYRGCRNLVVAVVTADDAENYTTNAPVNVAGVAEISKSVETSSEAHFYDNVAAVVINSEGSDTVTFTISVPDDKTLALLTGRTYIQNGNKFIESKRQQQYFAVGYVLGQTDGSERYVWRYKGTFNIPDESSATEDNGTGAKNMSLVYTGIYTEHQFANGKGTGIAGAAKSMSTVATAGSLDGTFFTAVQTPDTGA